MGTALAQLRFPPPRFGPDTFNPFLPILSNRGLNREIPSARRLKAENAIGGVLVNNKQVAGPPCSARNGVLGDCRTLIRCVRFVFEIDSLISTPCLLPGGHRGVCCPHTLVIYEPPRTTNILHAPPQPVVVVPNIRPSDISAAINIAKKNIKLRVRTDETLFKNDIFAKRGTSAFSAQKFKGTNRVSPEEAKKAFLVLETSVQLSARFQLSADQGTFALPKFSVKGSKIEDTCPAPPTNCKETSKYRTIDGSCNNMNITSWGKANTPLQRLLPSEYEDGLATPRTTGLPSARVLSTSLTSTQDKPDEKYTLMLMQWGQFVDHDITHTPTVKGTKEVGIICCGKDGKVLPKRRRHRDCFPIEIADNDSFYSKFKQTCMELVRSLPAPRAKCNFGPREQVNQITAWIDGSNIYGSEDKEAKNLRLLTDGRLRVTKVQGRDLLPLNPNDCSDEKKHRYCFAAGDLRCNEQLDLAVTHTLWMREHNRIARELKKMNPNWKDETLYQESRRIVIAQLQHITYNEWLPIIFGMKYMQKWKLEPKESGYSDDYDARVNPSITNAFSTAAFRFGHSMIQGKIESFNLFGSPVKTISLTKTQFEPYDLYDNLTLETFVRGLTTQKAQAYDTSFEEDLKGHLFETDSDNFGMDLVSLNIQRGRDHALPAYMKWRQLCGLDTVTSWRELSTILPEMFVARLQNLYKSVEDIDLFLGGLLENKEENEGILGPTFKCIIGDQFGRLKRGDRFWYERKETGFTLEQLNEIKQTSLARVLCENTEDIGTIQQLVFISPDVNNRRAACSSNAIPSIDLSKWKQQN